MIRHCDGTDRNLTAGDGSSPCACGLTFDDVEQMVIWPHHLVRPKLSLAELMALHEQLGELTDSGPGRIIGRAIEHSIEDPFTGEITVRFIPVDDP